MFHLQRGKGLFHLGVGDGVLKVSGIVKNANTSEEVKSMEPCSMFLLEGKLYIRDYCQSSGQAFVVYDVESLK